MEENRVTPVSGVKSWGRRGKEEEVGGKKTLDSRQTNSRWWLASRHGRANARLGHDAERDGDGIGAGAGGWFG